MMTCRICVVEAANAIRIFGGETTTYDIAQTIYEHLRFQPLPDDPISSIICLSCWKRIEEFHGYYLSVEKAQQRFADLRLEAVKVSSDIEDIKDEFEIEPIEAVIMNGEIPENIIEEISPKEESDLIKESDTDTLTDCNNDVNSQEPFSFLDSYLDEESDSDSKVQEDTAVTTKAANKKPAVVKRKVKVKNKSTVRKVKRKSETKKSTPRINLDEEIAKQTTLKCDVCPEEFLKFNLLQKHCREMHDIRGYVVCCLKKFYQRSDFFNHLARHVQVERPMCEICQKTYVDGKSLKKHIEIKHGSIESKIHQCDKCPSRFTKKFLLKQHLKTHEPKKHGSFPCEECNSVFKTLNSLQSHRRTIHELAYTVMCDICAKVFRSRASFEKHKSEHADVPPPRLQCPKCQRWYKNLDRLKRHIKDHELHDGKQHICDFCGKVSPTYVALKSHLKYRHLTQRTHKCTICDAAFKEKCTLTEHMATHTGVVLYSCPHCSKTSNSRSNMYAHRKRMHPEEWEKAKRLREMIASGS